MKIDRIYRFQPGEAVALVDYTNSAFCRPYIVNPAAVLKVSGVDDRHPHVRFIGQWVTIQPATGRPKRVRANNLIYRGYCEACERPAHERAGQLVCPVCHCLALHEPPPDRLAARLYEPDSVLQALRVRESLLTGCTRNDAYAPVDQRVRAARTRMLAALGLTDRDTWRGPFYDNPFFVGQFRILSIAEDVAGAKAAYEEQRLLQLARVLGDLVKHLPEESTDGLNLPARWSPPADDSQPDGPDAITRWLDREFDRAA